MYQLRVLGTAVAKIHANNPVFRNPKFAKEVFDGASRPLAWLIVSRRLRHSANAIFERENPVAQRFWAELHRINAPGTFDETKFPRPNFDAAYMLTAFAIENLLKGLMLAKGVATFSAQELPTVLQGHDLRRFHGRAKPAATISPHLLDALTYMSEWRARYPLPLKLADFWPMDDRGNPKGGGFSFPKTQDEFSAYCEALDAELKGLLSANDQRRIDLLVKP